MPRFYLLRGTGLYSDAGDYPEQPAERPDGEWVEGEPDGLNQFVPRALVDQLNEFFTANLPDETQADLATLKAAVKLEMEQNRPNIAKLIIQRATVPEELEPLRDQLLALFPEV